MLKGRFVPVGEDEALDQKDVSALVVWCPAHREFGETNGPLAVFARDREHGVLPQTRGDEAGDALPLDEEPRREVGASLGLDALKQDARSFDVEVGLLEAPHIDAEVGRQIVDDRIAGQAVRRPEGGAEGGETPAQRAEGIVGIGEEFGRERGPIEGKAGE